MVVQSTWYKKKFFENKIYWESKPGKNTGYYDDVYAMKLYEKKICSSLHNEGEIHPKST